MEGVREIHSGCRCAPSEDLLLFLAPRIETNEPPLVVYIRLVRRGRWMASLLKLCNGVPQRKLGRAIRCSPRRSHHRSS
jgi:hypothetical protein